MKLNVMTQAVGEPPLGCLDRLESESIHIIREAAAEFRNPVMLYSVGKDSSVMLALAIKAFAPGALPFPLLHIDTGWKFRETISFRDETASRLGARLIVHMNAEGAARGVGPVSHGSRVHTDVMKTEALRQALDKYGFDAVLGGVRREEDATRAKERIFSLRGEAHRWDPKRQRPEPWNFCNSNLAPGESIRVFPLSDWTELDIWLYIHRERIPVVPLYFAAPRPIVRREGALLVLDDGRLPLKPGEKQEELKVRFRTLGCWPLTSAIESNAASVPDIVRELLECRLSERSGRAIDRDRVGAMEQKKREGYF